MGALELSGISKHPHFKESGRSCGYTSGKHGNHCITHDLLYVGLFLWLWLAVKVVAMYHITASAAICRLVQNSEVFTLETIKVS